MKPQVKPKKKPMGTMGYDDYDEDEDDDLEEELERKVGCPAFVSVNNFPC